MTRADLIKRYLIDVARHQGGVESIGPAEAPASTHSETESLAPDGASAQPDPSVAATVDTANVALDKVKQHGMAAKLAPEEAAALEAIVLTRERPAVDIVGGEFHVDEPVWADLNADRPDPAIHLRLVEAIPAIGRIDLPGQTRIPYGGTGFIVGNGLVMTNRHVAEIFARQQGGAIDFKPGWRAALDLLHERGGSEPQPLVVKRVAMIHPYWDMALLEVDGVPTGASLMLSTRDVGDLDGHRVAVIGYPAFDPERNDVVLQNRIFDNTYGVKRLQPGRLGRRVQTGSFGKMVSAATHDCSTLGGNSGSAVIDLETGAVLALHFGGRYLATNYGVPAFELARDGRVVAAGVNFDAAGTGGTPPWQSYWDQSEMAGPAKTEPDRTQQAVSPPAKAPPLPAVAATTAPLVVADGDGVTITLPLTITVRLGAPFADTAESVAPAAVEAFAIGSEERLAEVWHDGDYADRTGYDPAFIGGIDVPLPRAADPTAVATLIDGGDTLQYRHFSIRMHRLRRLALFTASNVTAEKQLKRPESDRDYRRAALTGLGPNDREKWFPDPRLAAEFQLPDAFFTKDRNTFDKGHIVRRDDVAWGKTYDVLRQGNGDSYHVTNCSPQLAQFNQSQRGEDNWGDLENLVLADAASERLCVFAGPVLDPRDQIFAGVDGTGAALRCRIPSAFWKVVVAKRSDTELAAYAFVLDQDLSDVTLEFTVSDDFRRRMVPIAALEERTGVIFPDVVRAADAFEQDAGEAVAFRAGLERAPTVEDAAEQPTPNGGDDEAAAAEAGVVPPPSDTSEAVRPWRLAEALKVLRSQVNLKAPGRSTLSDGSIGDAAHQSRSSDHNPWVVEAGVGVVTAIDVTHDPAGGCDAGKLAEAIRAGADKRIKYVIWNRHIANREPINGAAAWAWRPYGGKNPHDHHIHISVRSDKRYYDAKDPWIL